MAVAFDLNKIFQFYFDILKNNKKIFNINSGVFMNINNKVHSKDFDDVITKIDVSKCLLT